MTINQELFNTTLSKKLKLRYKILLWIVSIVVLLTFLLQTNAYLSSNKPVKSEILVVEGWLPDYALQQVMQKFKAGNYKQIITTGGPLSRGSYLKEYKDHAHLAKATLVAMGMDEEDVIAVAASGVKRDRTYHSALALKKWMNEYNVHPDNFNIASLGPHTRRSAMLFQKVFGDAIRIGSIAIDPADYDPKKWYASSEGARSTINELIAYIYAFLK